MLFTLSSRKITLFYFCPSRFACLYSSYGYLILKMEEFYNSKIAVGLHEMRNVISNSKLDHFYLISSNMLLAYLKPAMIRYKTVLPIGSAVLIESKRAMIADYYFRILPMLYTSNIIKKSSLRYADTGSD